MESEDCLGCHSEVDEVGEELFINKATFDHTKHAELGCSDCHESVTEEHPDDGQSPTKASCKDCHDDIFKEYKLSAHGTNADCSDCHNPHTVKSTTQVSGFDMNGQCATCHDITEMTDTHAEWLPQAALHIKSLPCITCHTASDNYVITMYLIKSGTEHSDSDFIPASLKDLEELAGDDRIKLIIDTDNSGYISLEELRSFNGNPKYKDVRLWGMMTPEAGTHDYQILDNRWDCSFCHASGPSAMQTSYVSFPKKDGTYTRLTVEKGAVLDILNGTPDFYMMGATRSKWLNIAGLMIIVGGMIMPVGHGTLRFLTRKNRAGKGH